MCHKSEIRTKIRPLKGLRVFGAEFCADRSMIYGYARYRRTARASRTGRSAEEARACKVFRASGAKTDRPQLRRLLNQLDAGDVLTVTRLDRLSCASEPRNKLAPRRLRAKFRYAIEQAATRDRVTNLFCQHVSPAVEG